MIWVLMLWLTGVPTKVDKPPAMVLLFESQADCEAVAKEFIAERTDASWLCFLGDVHEHASELLATFLYSSITL
jgi:hypothetical protein